ncbi:hypothetical protein ACKKBG_A37475 [Auxenochlorella protothecoides x Auxenochlorella symbiontica]
MAELPWTEADVIQRCQHEYQVAAREGGQEGQDATVRLAWAQVHSTKTSDVDRGVELLQAMLTQESADTRDLLYLLAVGQYRRRHYLDARTTLRDLLKGNPEFRQAESLLKSVDEDIVRDGLVGVGAGAAVIGVIGAIAYAALRKR